MSDSTQTDARYVARRAGNAVAVICLLSFVLVSIGGAASAGETTVSLERRTSAPPRDTITVPTVRAPANVGKGTPVLLIGTKPDVANFDYETTEVFFSGTATSYASAQSLTADGNWTVTEEASAPYTSRMILHRPKDPADFNGTVFVEWLNVTGGFDYRRDAQLRRHRDHAIRCGLGWCVGATGWH